MPPTQYSTALKSGKKDIQTRAAAEQSTELPCLDSILEKVEIRGEVPLGLIDILRAEFYAYSG